MNLGDDSEGDLDMLRKVQAREWTEAHRREALRRLRELAAIHDVDALAADAADACREEVTFRASVATLGADVVGREVRRVRGLAEGRLVRDSILELRDNMGTLYSTATTSEEHVRWEWRTYGGRLVRVTRIRKAVRP